jgi:hypothetical protein
MMHGMHIYGWPISAKLMEFGWNKHRNPPDVARETSLPKQSVRTTKVDR